MSIVDCFLCDGLSDRGGFAGLSPRIRLAADIAPLAPGHTLIYPTKHCQSIAQLDPDDLDEFVTALKVLRPAGVFVDHLLYFEHGIQANRTTFPGCCDHAHVHVLPLKVDSQPHATKEASKHGMSGVLDRLLAREEHNGQILFRDRIPLIKIGQFKNEEYCWISFDIDAIRTFNVPKAGRQYIRMIVAEFLGTNIFETWNRYDSGAAIEWTKVLLGRIGMARAKLSTERDA